MSDAFRQMREAARLRGGERARAAGDARDEDRRRLQQTCETKIKTAFVGALAQVEEYFGDLWGRGRRPEEMTEVQRRWWEQYQAVRNAVLNNGNAQARAARAELELYEVAWRGCREALPVRGPEGT